MTPAEEPRLEILDLDQTVGEMLLSQRVFFGAEEEAVEQDLVVGQAEEWTARMMIVDDDFGRSWKREPDSPVRICCRDVLKDGSGAQG